MENQKKLLRDRIVQPTPEVLRNVMDENVFAIYQQMLQIMTEFGLSNEWNFYRDNGAWVCKIAYKKKTILWLSAWEGFIKVSFYFTDKTSIGILDADINPAIKSAFEVAKPIGKLLPLTIDISSEDQLTDLRTIIAYKKSLK